MKVDKIVYHPKGELNHSRGEKDFFVYVDSDQFEKWKKDESIPLVDVVQAFTVFECPTGAHHGVESKASKAVLANAFNTENESEIIFKILKNGKLIHASAPTSSSKGYVSQ